MTVAWGPADRSVLTPIEGGVTAVAGVRAAGIAAGIKPSGRPDLALVVLDRPGTIAVTATTNTFRAPPVEVAVRNAAGGVGRAVVVNAGNANAGTGRQGLADAEAMVARTADLLGIPADQVVPMSTGVIGVPLPMDRLEAGLPVLVAGLDHDGGSAAAAAICTTDTVSKQVAYEVTDAAGTCRIGAMAKGVGMLEPAMATMLCVVTTDAAVEAADLRGIVRTAVDRTFNRISVDGCGSTNDTVAVLASGAADATPGLDSIAIAIEAVCADLADMMVHDGEGVTKVAQLQVTAAASEADAVSLARAVAASALFRSALWGSDPNWGRVLAAMGSTPVAFDPARVSVSFGGHEVCRGGTAVPFDREAAAAAMGQREVPILIDLGDGECAATFLTADLTPEYVRFNGEYTT